MRVSTDLSPEGRLSFAHPSINPRHHTSTNPQTWPTVGGDNSRRGAFPGLIRLRSRPVHRLRASGALQASVLVDEAGRVYTADLAGGIDCFSAAGKTLWSVKLAGGISATPACGRFGSPNQLSEPRLFVGTHTGLVYALNPETGEVVWRVEIPTSSDPRVISDLLLLARAELVVLSSWGGKFCALDASTGETRFSWDAGFAPRAAASADSSEAIYCMRATVEAGIEVLRVDAKGRETVLFKGGSAHSEEGQPAGDWARRAMVAAAPIVDEKRGRLLFVVNGEEESILYGWSLAGNEQVWRVVLPSQVQATPALRDDGTVIVADLAGSVLGLTQGGGPGFRYQTGCEYLLAGAVCEASGTVFIGDPQGIVHSIGSDGTGRKLFETPRAIQARPSLGSDGKLYVPAMDRLVYVFASG